VFPGKTPRTVETARFLEHVRVGGERRDRAADEEWRLRRDEVRIFLHPVAPVRFRDTKVLEHHLAAHEAWRYRQRCHAMRPQLLGHGVRETADVHFHEIEKQRLAIAKGV